MELLGQPRFAQSIKVMLVVFRILEHYSWSRSPANRVAGFHTHDLRNRHPSLFVLAYLCVGRGQPDIPRAEIRRPRDALVQQRQRLCILLEQVVGKSQEAERKGPMEWIKSHLRIDDI